VQLHFFFQDLYSLGDSFLLKQTRVRELSSFKTQAMNPALRFMQALTLPNALYHLFSVIKLSVLSIRVNDKGNKDVHTRCSKYIDGDMRYLALRLHYLSSALFLF
jgi:hypothetical protein